MRITDKHVFFFSYKDMFSNHYRCENRFGSESHQVRGVDFATVEHYMMYEKATLFSDIDAAHEIYQTWSPQSAKAIGRRVKGFDNRVWESWREQIVTQGLVAKMMANPRILAQALDLYNQGLVFVEASPFDAIWGVKLSEFDARIDDPALWQGKNLLGKCWHEAIEFVQGKRT